MRLVPLSLAAPLFLAGIASAQGINVDVGTANAVPAATFGAAAAQPGVWNLMPYMNVGAPMPLVNLAGAATPVTVTLTAGLPPNLFSSPNAGTPNGICRKAIATVPR